MPLNILRYLLHGQIIGIAAKGVFNFFCNQLQAGHHVKDKSDNGDGEITQAEGIAKRQRHNVKEDEFFDEGAVGVRDGRILDALAGAADIHERKQFVVQHNQLVAGYFLLFVQQVGFVHEQ